MFTAMPVAKSVVMPTTTFYVAMPTATLKATLTAMFMAMPTTTLHDYAHKQLLWWLVWQKGDIIHCKNIFSLFLLRSSLPNIFVWKI
jgi:hypothetical protein